MSQGYPLVSESCTQCPYVDEFHGTCGHDLRQVLIQEFSGDGRAACPLFPEVYAEAMRDLESQYDD